MPTTESLTQQAVKKYISGANPDGELADHLQQRLSPPAMPPTLKERLIAGIDFGDELLSYPKAMRKSRIPRSDFFKAISNKSLTPIRTSDSSARKYISPLELKKFVIEKNLLPYQITITFKENTMNHQKREPLRRLRETLLENFSESELYDLLGHDERELYDEVEMAYVDAPERQKQREEFKIFFLDFSFRLFLLRLANSATALYFDLCRLCVKAPQKIRER